MTFSGPSGTHKTSTGEFLIILNDFKRQSVVRRFGSKIKEEEEEEESITSTTWSNLSSFMLLGCKVPVKSHISSTKSDPAPWSRTPAVSKGQTPFICFQCETEKERLSDGGLGLCSAAVFTISACSGSCDHFYMLTLDWTGLVVSMNICVVWQISALSSWLELKWNVSSLLWNWWLTETSYNTWAVEIVSRIFTFYTSKN